MRLGQLARKYDVSVQEITSFLERAGSANSKLHPNAKLDEEDMTKVAEHFDLPPDLPEEILEEAIEVPIEPSEQIAEPAKEIVPEVPKPIEEELPETIESAEALEPPPLVHEAAIPATPEEEIALLGGDIAFGPTNVDEHIEDETEIVPENTIVEHEPPKEELPEENDRPQEDEIIDTERLLELLEAEETPAGLEKIKLIKASKKELSGLKVLGKIEVPEPVKKKKEKEKEEQGEVMKSQEKKQALDPETRAERARIRAKQREKNRLIARQKEEERLAKQQKRKKEKEEKERKAIREAKYKQRLKQQQTNIAKPKQPIKAKKQPITQKTVLKKPKPKTLLGKFWRWLNPQDTDW